MKKCKLRASVHTRYPGQVDNYPRIDIYIPQACQEADKIAEPKTIGWTRAFLKAMDTILSKKGLRVL